MLDKAPIAKVPQPENKRIHWLESHEAQRLIDKCPEPLKFAVGFALTAGLRRPNIINLGWQQIDTQCRVARINPEESKSNRVIGVALSDTARHVLEKQIGNHYRWVFMYEESCTRPDGTRAPTAREVRYDADTAWEAALGRAGISDFGSYDLRHAWASRLVQTEVPLPVLQEMGGWESTEVIRRYVHLAPNHLTEHTRQIDSTLNPSAPNSPQSRNKEDTSDV